MQREMYFVHDPVRLKELSKCPEETLGVGFFWVQDALPEPGVSLYVDPPHLRPLLLHEVAEGHISPLSHEILFVGDTSCSLDDLPAQRWLLMGLPALGFLDAELSLTVKPLVPELLTTQNADDALYAVLYHLQTTLLNLRAFRVFFLLNLVVLYNYIQALCEWRKLSKIEYSLFCHTFFQWWVEESLHPCVVFLCRNQQEQKEYLNYIRKLKPEEQMLALRF